MQFRCRCTCRIQQGCRITRGGKPQQVRGELLRHLGADPVRDGALVDGLAFGSGKLNTDRLFSFLLVQFLDKLC
mgnify:CR=1 FL=1